MAVRSGSRFSGRRFLPCGQGLHPSPPGFETGLRFVFISLTCSVLSKHRPGATQL